MLEIFEAINFELILRRFGAKLVQTPDNTYYEHFEDFKAAIFGFFSTLSNAGVGSELREAFRSRVRDKFRPIQAQAANS